jgi:anti-sigma factor ChrR (cupin superfamily)
MRQIADAAAWRPGLWPGSTMLTSEPLFAARTLIARLPPGMLLARHRHQARELTFILDGELIEDGEHTHRTGAVLERAAGTVHELAVAQHTSCLVVFSLSAT